MRFVITVSDETGHEGYDVEAEDMDQAVMESGILEDRLSGRDEGTVTLKIQADPA